MTAPVFTMETVSALCGLSKPTPKPDEKAIANKYVIYERPNLEGVEGLRLGDPHDLHADMLPKGARVVSAGFYQTVLVFTSAIKPILEVRVWGYSESLGVTSRPTDSAVIKAHLTR